jgi:predicted metal-dependent hydrolase
VAPRYYREMRGEQREAAMRSSDAHELWVEGIELFNAGRFFDCHEVWEEVWKRANDAERLFNQAIIQAAVAMLHAERGNRRGARSTWHKARAKLDSLPAEHMGIALGELRSAVDAFITSPRACETLAARPKIRRL